MISIIIPTLNESAGIGALLDDLRVARDDGHQIIIADGGSADETLALAAARVDDVVSAPKGRARQLNEGARRARGDILWFLHADSRVPATACAEILRSITTKRCWGRFNVRLSGSHWLFRLIEHLMNLRSCFTGIATGDQGLFVTRTAFDTVGGVPDIPLMEDIALSKALRRLSRPVCLRTRLTTSSRRWEQKGIIRTILLMWRLRLAYALGADPARLAKAYDA